MKARIVKTQPERVLCYQLGEGWRELEKIFSEMGIEGIVVTEEQLGQAVGALAGMPGDFSQPLPPVAADFSTPCMVLSGFTRERLNLLLGKTQHLTQGVLKAVVTEHNKNWSFQALMREIAEEHRLMNLMQALGRRTAAAEKRPGAAHKGSPLQKAVATAKEALRSPQPDIHTLERAAQQLEQALS